MQQLCFEVSPIALRYSIIDTERQDVVKSNSMSLSSRIEELKKEACSNFLRNENLLDFDGEVTLAYSGAKVTLAPQVIFGESNAKDIFELCFGPSDETIEHNRFFEQTLVVVYEIEAWVKRFFVVRFPRIVIQHEITHVLRGIFQKNTFEPVNHLVVNTDFFSIILVEKNKISFFNTFDYATVEDLFYYSAYVWSNSTTSEKKKKTIFWHANDENNTLFTDYKAMYLDLPNADDFSFSKSSKTQHQLLCV